MTKNRHKIAIRGNFGALLVSQFIRGWEILKIFIYHPVQPTWKVSSRSRHRKRFPCQYFTKITLTGCSKLQYYAKKYLPTRSIKLLYEFSLILFNLSLIVN